MRWCAALAVVLVALVVLTVKVGRRSPRHTPAAKPEIAEAVEPAATPDGRAPPAPASFERHEASGIAHVHGRVLFPPGSQPPDEVEVVAECGTRTFDAAVEEDGRFQLHLPPGHYTLAASAGELIGTTPDILLRGGAAREVDIRLAVGAAIRGNVRLPAGGLGASPSAPDGFEVSATIAGGEGDSGVASIEEGTFAVKGLLPGRRYDLHFQGPSVRTLTMSGVTAPIDGLFVELQRRATISGAIGFERGARCPISDVTLLIDGKESDDDDAWANVGRDCTFTLTVPDQAAVVTVAATGKGWFLEQQVAIPAQGDPGPICLNPPCRSNSEEDFGRLRLTLDGAPKGSYIDATLHPTGKNSDSGTFHSCFGPDGACAIAGLFAGDTFAITASGDDCRGDPVPITIVAGDNHVRIPCHRERKIEGVIHVPEDQRPDSITVRCAGGSWKPLVETRLFRITCESDVTALEYRIGTNGALRSVPIASLAGSGPAFVDIGY